MKKYIALGPLPRPPHVILEKILWVAGKKLKFKSIPQKYTDILLYIKWLGRNIKMLTGH